MTISISQDFLEAFSNLPRAQQKKARAFIEKFREDPTSPGINYETINGASDPNLRSVRIDQAYRGIVLKPDSGDVYVLLWVDHHDDAYQWAANKRVAVHPDTGVLQVVPASEDDAPTLNQEEGSAPEAPAREGLFRDLRDRDLLRLGLPDVLVPVVRNVETDEDLDRLAPHLPEEAGEALYMIAAGFSLEEVDREFAWRGSQEPVDTDDFAAALRRPDSQRRFATVDGEDELAEMLDAPLKHWRVFLHPSQRSLVTMNANGPVRVLGGAGTGKTVVAMHRARWLVENVLDAPRQRVLFTTFTRNLAADIRANLALLCPPEVLDRIEVTHLDGWLSGYLKAQQYAYDVDYAGTRTRPLWDEASAQAPEGTSASFLRAEWEETVVPQEVESLADYVRADRRGRGTPLSRRDRKALWPVFEEYRTLLDEHRLREPALAMQDARALLQRDDVLPYRSIVVDEAQDFGASAFRLLRAMVPPAPHDLFVVGDAHQRIYASRVVLGHCGIDIVGRGRKLRVNYRTTEQTRRWAVALLGGVPVDDLDGGEDSQRGYRSLVQGVPAHRHALRLVRRRGRRYRRASPRPSTPPSSPRRASSPGRAASSASTRAPSAPAASRPTSWRQTKPRTGRPPASASPRCTGSKGSSSTASSSRASTTTSSPTRSPSPTPPTTPGARRPTPASAPSSTSRPPEPDAPSPSRPTPHRAASCSP